VFALGDVTGRVELTPMAIAAGRRLADRLFAGMKDAKVGRTRPVLQFCGKLNVCTCNCSLFWSGFGPRFV